MDSQQQGIDGNKVINKLSEQNAELSRSIAILKVEYDDLYNAYVKQQELINAYENKEQLIEQSQE